MFILDMPYVPMQEVASAQVAQADVALRTLKICQEFSSTENMPKLSAERIIEPSGMVANYWERKFGQEIPWNSIPNRVIQAPKHGTLQQDTAPDGTTVYAYDPDPGFIGRDSVVFEVIIKGKRLRVSMLLIVHDIFDGKLPECAEPRLVGFRTVPDSNNTLSLNDSAGNISAWLRNAELSALLANASAALTGFTGLPGLATAETTTAAGYGWYIESTHLLIDADSYSLNSNPVPAGNIINNSYNYTMTEIQAKRSKKKNILKLCHNYGNDQAINPIFDAVNFLFVKQPKKDEASNKKYFADLDRLMSGASVKLIEPPIYGTYFIGKYDENNQSKITYVPIEGDDGFYVYVPPSMDFTGEDRWSFEVTLKDGRKAIVRYEMSPGDSDVGPECKRTLLGYLTGLVKENEPGRVGRAQRNPPPRRSHARG